MDIKKLIESYAVLGGDAMFSYAMAPKADIVALSIEMHRNPHAIYRIATLADGSTWLAVRYGRKPYQPVFNATRSL